MNKKDLLFRNSFINPSVSNFKNIKNRELLNEKFRKNYEEKNKKSKPMFRDLNDLTMTNPISENFISENEQILRSTMSKEPENRFFRTLSSLVSIDSRDRDKSIYPFSNNYKIFLNRQFRNIKSVRLRSTEIINSESLIRDTPVSRTNNKIYWMDRDDDRIYVVTIPAGNYTPSDIQDAIETVTGVIQDKDGFFHNFSVFIDTVANQVTFTLVKRTQLSNPFSTVAGTSIITVNHNNHGFATGQMIFISNANLYGVLENVLNSRHIINVLDSDHYTINLNIDGGIPFTTVTPKGGKEVYIGIGAEFSLLWSYPDSVGSILGFEPVDTPFGNIISNTQIKQDYSIQKIVHLDSIYSIIVLLYPLDGTLNASDYVYIHDVVGTDNDILINDPGGYIISNVTDIDAANAGLSDDEHARSFKFPIPVTVGTTRGGLQTRTLTRPVKLSGENYMFICCKELESAVSSGKVKDIFAKVQLDAPPGAILFNTFHSSGKEYASPLPELSELTFTFKTQDDHLFDFIGSDHSFTLEITEQIHEMNGDINISSRLGFRDQS